jgi:hypothetical protein
MNETKKVYVKPAIEGVYLLPDEAVLGVCKTQYGNGPAVPDHDCLNVGFCREYES